MANHLYDALFLPHEGSDRLLLDLPSGQVTYGDFLKTSARYANAMAALGVKPGDRVAMQVSKSPEALAVYAACVRSRAVLLPLNTAYTAGELDYFIGDAEPALVLVDPKDLASLADAAPSVLSLGADGSGSFPDLAATQSDGHSPVAAKPDDLAAILYTSGTTGRSKGAMLSHDNLLSNTQALCDLWQFTSDDVLIHALPIFHTHGLFVAVNCALLSNSSMIFMAKFDAEAVLAALPRATAMMGVPTFYTRLLDTPGFDRPACAGMRLFVSGSAPLLAETHIQFEDRTGHRILERYGMTETNMNTSNPYDGDRIAGTVGLPLPGVEVQVCDDQGQPIATGETGIVEVRGPNVFQGYWRMPEKTADELRPSGFFITGDLGRFDDNRYLTIVGRQKDLIIGGGFNIYPKEVEEALDDLDGVLESAVIGVPHKDLGEGVVAIVVAEPGQTLSPESLKDALVDKLARFKQPRLIVLVDELPRNTMGKVQKAALRETYKDTFLKIK